jgi:putative transposase
MIPAREIVMGRARVILQNQFPYNISARCINREWFQLEMEAVWKIFCQELCRVHEKQNLKIHSFVLMSNHFHLIASTPLLNISECMHQFMGQTSRRLSRAGNRINETFAGRHFKCVLDHHSYYLNAYKYNYRNPVTAGISNSVEDYPFSSICGVLSSTNAQFPIEEDTTYRCDPKGTVEWLNRAPSKIQADALRKSLRHARFQSPKSRIDGRPLIE